MKAVFVADSPAQAHLVSGLLEESGIRNVVEGEMLFGVRADIGLTPASLPRVSVLDEDFEKARAVLEHRDPSTAPAAAPDQTSVSERRKKFDVLFLGALGTGAALAVLAALFGFVVLLAWGSPFAGVVLILMIAIAALRLSRRS